MALDVERGIKEIIKKIDSLRDEQKIIVVGIAGGTGSGKGFIAKKLLEQLSDAKHVEMDDYYFGLDLFPDNNFDHPRTFDWRMFKMQLEQMKNGSKIFKPKYDFTKHKRAGFEWFEPSDILIVEGMWILNEKVKDLVDVKVFVDAPTDKRLERKIKRDLEERQRTKESVIEAFNNFAEPMFKIHVEPTKKFADVVIKNG